MPSFDQLFTAVTVPMALLDRGGRLRRINPALATAWGCPAEAAEDRPLTDFLPPESAGRIETFLTGANAASPVCLEVFCRAGDGRTRPTLLSARVLPAPQGEDSILLMLEGRSSPEQAHDGGPGESLLRDRLAHALRKAQREGRRVALLLINLNRFRDFTASFGLSRGELLLKEVQERLRAAFRQSDTVVHCGGEKFAVVLEGIKEAATVPLPARKVFSVLETPFFPDEQEVFLTATVGISLFPDDGDSPASLLERAEQALARTREEHRNRYQFYAQEMNARARERLRLESALYRAVERGEFELHYQPQVATPARTVVGAEALLRWQDPVLGYRPPAEFIPVLEETGLIKAAGEWVLRQACTQARAWRRRGYAFLRMAVNVSPRQLQDDGFAEMVEKVLKETGLEAEALDLEITEGALTENGEESTSALAALAEAGVRVVVDDFGTGWSSLSRLKRFPVHAVKIDRSFVSGIPHDRDDTAIATAILALAGSLGLRVTAEGVETREQLAYLQGLRCHQIQGFFFAKPMPAAEFSGWLRQEWPGPAFAPGG